MSCRERNGVIGCEGSSWLVLRWVAAGKLESGLITYPGLGPHGVCQPLMVNIRALRRFRIGITREWILRLPTAFETTTAGTKVRLLGYSNRLSCVLFIFRAPENGGNGQTEFIAF